jgi:hypothetical protein
VARLHRRPAAHTAVPSYTAAEHTGLGILLGLVGGLTLPWLVPLLISRHYGRIEEAIRAEEARPKRGQPYPLTESSQVSWDGGGGCWWTEHDGWWWRLDRGAASWRRGDPLPARTFTGDPGDANRAATQHELLRRQNRLIEEQNRLIAGKPPPELPAIFAI